jgi:ferritin-like protein
MAKEMIAATEVFPPSSPGDGDMLGDVRAAYGRDAEPVGTMPPPRGIAEAARTAVRAVTGGAGGALLDKLGERLAFEASGTRLYDAAISKVDGGRSFRGGPTRDDLMHIRQEEHEHFTLLAQVIEQLGGDPTVVTPSANLQAVISKGIPAVLADPRTDMRACLEALVTAELVDNECWPALIELTEEAGETELAERCREALAHEREHLERVRTWLAVAGGRSAERARRVGADTSRETVARPVGRRAAEKRGSHAGNGRTAKKGSRPATRGRGRPAKQARPRKKRAGRRR